MSYNTATEVFKAEGRPSTVQDPTGPGARVRGMFQPRSESSGKDKAKDAVKDAAKDKGGARESGKTGSAPAAAPSVTLRSAGDLTPPASK